MAVRDDGPVSAAPAPTESAAVDPCAAADPLDPWAGVVGQPAAVRQLTAAAVSPVHAYLLVGPPGSGARPLARGYAGLLLSATATTDDSTCGAPAPQRSISSPTRSARPRDPRAPRSSAAAWGPPGDAPDRLVILQFTSGSTSDPKGVMLPHHTVGANLDAIAHAYLVAHDAYPSELGYRGHPHTTSPPATEAICHSIPVDTALVGADAPKTAITARAQGIHGDPSATFLV